MYLFGWFLKGKHVTESVHPNECCPSDGHLALTIVALCKTERTGLSQLWRPVREKHFPILTLDFPLKNLVRICFSWFCPSSNELLTELKLFQAHIGYEDIFVFWARTVVCCSLAVMFWVTAACQNKSISFPWMTSLRWPMWFVCSVVPLSSTVGGVLESLGAETRGTSLSPERCCSLADLGQVAASCWVVFPHI